MPHADGNEDWRKERALAYLRIADGVRKSAVSYLHETECDYGRRWAAALETCSREELAAAGFAEPVVQCGRNPEKLKAMRSTAAPRPYPGFQPWTERGREYTPPPETHPSLLDYTVD